MAERSKYELATNLRKFFHYTSTIPEDFTVRRTEEVVSMVNESEGNRLLVSIYHAIDAPPKNSFTRIRLYQDLLMKAGLRILYQEDLIKALIRENERLGEGIGDRGRKRWTEEEDELLIEMAARDDVTIINLCKEFGRTPGAIKSHISKLVGIKRLSADIAGRFIGTLDGVEVEGDIEGIVRYA